MDALRASRWANSSEQVLVAPHYRIAAGDSAVLILVNRFGRPLGIAINAHGAGGTSYPLAGIELEARGTAQIDLAQSLRDAPDTLREGSLRVSHFGDPEMLQAWIVLSGQKGSLELPLTKASASDVSHWFAFWDSRLLGRGEKLQPRLYFHNVQATEVVVEVAAEPRSGSGTTYRLHVGGGQTATLEPEAHGRWDATSLRIEHDGQPGQVAAIGLLEGRRTFLSLPLLPATATPYGDLRTKVYDSLAMPLPADPGERGATDASTVLSLFNYAAYGEADQVRLALIDRSGERLAELSRTLRPGEIRSTDLDRLIGDHAGRDLRLEVSTETGSLLPAAVAIDERGLAIDVALLPRTKVHASGTYPLPSLQTHEAATTILNVGAEPAEILGHVEWEDGAYSLQPITVPPGAFHRIDFNELARAGAPDLLGRTFPGDHERAFFEWHAKNGASSILARTEMRRQGDHDVVGFNCFGCCEEFPYGAIIPSGIAFDVGQTPPFDAVIYMSTCSGTVGPYSATPDFLTYSSPLTWDGSTISSSGYTSQTVEFSERIAYQWVDCTQRERTVRGAGPAAVDTCQEEHNPDYDHSKGCTGMYGGDCEGCKACADREHAVAKCRCNKLIAGKATCLAGEKIGCERIKQQCLATSPETCANSDTTCS